MKKWIVEYEKEPAGEAMLVQQGMYYKVMCRLFKSYQEKCRIEILQPSGNIDMGLCVPYQSFYGCIKSMPISHLNTENLHFLLRKENEDKYFAVIRTGESFSVLWQVPKSKLIKQGKEYGIIITK